jgi:hypothetical protein
MSAAHDEKSATEILIDGTVSVSSFLIHINIHPGL